MVVPSVTVEDHSGEVGSGSAGNGYIYYTNSLHAQ